MPDFATLTAVLIVPLVKIALLVGALMTAAAYLVLLERLIAAWVQDRIGPNRVGPFGLLQPLADGLKFIFKEEYTPAHVDKVLFILAPITILAAALAIFAVIPFGSVLPPLDIPGVSDPIELVVAPGVDVGMVYVFALSSIAVYGVILGSWASNSKYSFLGGLRSSAQLIAYEIPLGLGILGVVLFAGSLKLDTIIVDQAQSGVWNLFTQPLGFVIFLVASFAESARLPFDLPECEQELVGGYHTEYAGMKLLLFLIAEFLHMVVAAFLIVILYLGGWHLWGLTGSTDPKEPITWTFAILRVVVFVGKVMAVILFFMMVRWSWPRFRFDQLMALAWKVMLPLGLFNLVAVAVVTELIVQEKAGMGFAVVVGWVVLLVGWMAAAMWSPLHDDNRPKLTAHEFDTEQEMLTR